MTVTSHCLAPNQVQIISSTIKELESPIHRFRCLSRSEALRRATWPPPSLKTNLSRRLRRKIQGRDKNLIAAQNLWRRHVNQSGLQLSKVPHFWLSKIPSLCTFSTSNPVQIITDWFMFINISPKRGVRDWLLSRGSAQ